MDHTNRRRHHPSDAGSLIWTILLGILLGVVAWLILEAHTEAVWLELEYELSQQPFLDGDL